MQRNLPISFRDFRSGGTKEKSISRHPDRFEMPATKWVIGPVFLLSCLCLWLPLAGNSLAQAPTPGEVQETLRPPPATPEKAPPAPEIRIPPAPQPPAPADERRVRVDRFSISGNTVFSEKELREAISFREGAELTLAEMYEVADLLTRFYQTRGYSLATVTVPAQRLRDGILQLEVVEGRVGRLVFNGNRAYGNEFLSRRFVRMQPGAVVRFAELEREILLLNDLPGLVARSVLQPGAAYGTSDIHLHVRETRINGRATLDNHGRQVIGEWRAGADFTINNPLGFGDALSLGYTHTEAGLLRQGRIGYGFQVHPSGTSFDLNYSRAEYEAGAEFAPLGIEGVSETGRLQVSQPLIRSRRANLAWTVGGAYIKGESDISGLILSDDEITFLETGLHFGRHRSGGATMLSTLLAGNFRSNSQGDRNDALPPRLEIKGLHEHVLGYGFSALLRGEAVLGTGPLPDSNKYALGGPASVRGFVSSRLRGDYGGMGSLEMRHFWRFADFGLQVRAFLDAGAVVTRGIPGAPRTSESLTAGGAGLGVFFAEHLSLDLQWAKPLDGKESGDDRDSSLWLTVSAGF
jgi:hemolysin activation/secretion protein